MYNSERRREKNGEKQKLGTNLDDIFSIIGQLKIKNKNKTKKTEN
jgi:hypothetical protein